MLAATSQTVPSGCDHKRKNSQTHNCYFVKRPRVFTCEPQQSRVKTGLLAIKGSLFRQRITKKRRKIFSRKTRFAFIRNHTCMVGHLELHTNRDLGSRFLPTENRGKKSRFQGSLADNTFFPNANTRYPRLHSFLNAPKSIDVNANLLVRSGVHYNED